MLIDINIIFFLFAAFFANAQIVISDFNDGNRETWIESATKLSIVDSTLKVECVVIGGVGQYKLFFVNIHGNPKSIL